jgi:Serine incorporator (Serinc).
MKCYSLSYAMIFVTKNSDESVLLQRNNDDKDVESRNQQGQGPNKTRAKVSGLVVNNRENDQNEEEDYATMNDGPNEDGHENQIQQTFSSSWKINMILSLICCWYAMSLTSWGSVVGGGGNLANPSAGKVSMWMIISSQWLMNLLYLWTLVAPKIFPDRDFS